MLLCGPHFNSTKTSVFSCDIKRSEEGAAHHIHDPGAPWPITTGQTDRQRLLATDVGPSSTLRIPIVHREQEDLLHM